ITEWGAQVITACPRRRRPGGQRCRSRQRFRPWVQPRQWRSQGPRVWSLKGRTMPSYEYYCRHCDRTFTVHMSLKDHETEEVRCVHCQGTQVEQVLTSFVAVTSKKS